MNLYSQSLNANIMNELNSSFEDWNISDDILSETSSEISSVRVQNSSSKMVNSVLSCSRRVNTGCNTPQKRMSLGGNPVFEERTLKKSKFKSASQKYENDSISSLESSFIGDQEEEPVSLKQEISQLLKQMVQRKKSKVEDTHLNDKLWNISDSPSNVGNIKKDHGWVPQERLVTVEDLINPCNKF